MLVSTYYKSISVSAILYVINPFDEGQVDHARTEIPRLFSEDELRHIRILGIILNKFPQDEDHSNNRNGGGGGIPELSVEEDKKNRKEFCRKFCEEELDLAEAIPKRVAVTCYLIDVVNEGSMKGEFIE